VLGNHLARAHDLLADHIACDSIPKGWSVVNNLRFSCMHAQEELSLVMPGIVLCCVMKAISSCAMLYEKKSRTDAGVSAGS
jgi:hypothetical protein